MFEDKSNSKRKRSSSSSKSLLSPSSSSPSSNKKNKIILSNKLEFINKFTYQNTLNYPPCGPYSLSTDLISSLPRPLSDYSKYKVSSLDKSYIYKPNLSIDMNLSIDFLNSNLLNYDNNNNINNLFDNKNNKSKSLSNAANPWWLRNTTYIENNLFSTTHKTNKIVSKIDNKVDNKIESKLDDKIDDKEDGYIDNDIYNINNINESFNVLDETINKLLKSTKKTIDYSIDILPYHNDLSNDSKQLSFVRYDEPINSSNNNTNNIITNIRKLDNNKLFKANTFESSLAIASNNTSEEYEWYKDYTMEFVNSNITDSYILSINELNQEISYYPIKSRIQMNKMPIEDSKPVDVTLIRNN